MPSEIAFGFFRIGSESFLKFGFGLDHFGSDRIRTLKFTNYRIGNFQSDPMHTFSMKHLPSMNFNLWYILVQVNVNRTLNVIQNLHSVILDNLVANEEPSTIESENLSLQVEKKTARALGESVNKLKNCSFKPPSGDAFGLGESMLI